MQHFKQLCWHTQHTRWSVELLTSPKTSQLLNRDTDRKNAPKMDWMYLKTSRTWIPWGVYVSVTLYKACFTHVGDTIDIFDDTSQSRNSPDTLPSWEVLSWRGWFWGEREVIVGWYTRDECQGCWGLWGWTRWSWRHEIRHQAASSW